MWQYLAQNLKADANFLVLRKLAPSPKAVFNHQTGMDWYASSYPVNWTVKNWFVQDFKGHGHDTDEWRDYDEDNVSDEDSIYFPWPALQSLMR